MSTPTSTFIGHLPPVPASCFAASDFLFEIFEMLYFFPHGVRIHLFLGARLLVLTALDSIFQAKLNKAPCIKNRNISIGGFAAQ